MSVNSLSLLSQQLAARLQSKSYAIAVVESCTGGELAAALTSVPGASAWFQCGWITYSNDSKEKRVGVSRDTLEQWGAVSEAVAGEMAAGALARAEVHVALSITGIAGPGGGSADKPVGMVCFGLAQLHQPVKTKTCFFKGTREAIRRQACCFALEWILDQL